MSAAGLPKQEQEEKSARASLQADVSYEDSPYALRCASFVGRPVRMTFVLYQNSSLHSSVTAEVLLPSRKDSTTTARCNLLMMPGSKHSDIATLVHAMTAAAALPHFPFKDECGQLIALMRSEDTAQLNLAPHGFQLKDVCKVAAQASSMPIVPMLACSLELTERVTPTWSITVRKQGTCCCVSRSSGARAMEVGVSVRQKADVVLRMSFRATDSEWYLPANLQVTFQPGCSTAKQSKAMSFLLKNKHVKTFPMGLLLKQLAHHVLSINADSM